jgi:peptide/nickel transport system permease protein
MAFLLDRPLMIIYIVRRVLQAFVVLIVVSLIVFLLTHIIPGGEARAVLGARATPTAIAHFNQVNGLNLPVWEQYWQLLVNYAHLRLGYSYKNNQPVAALIEQALPKTLVLVALALLLALILAIPVGVFQATRRNKPDDYVLTGVAFFFYSMPTFFLGPALILIFAIRLNWFSFEAPQSQSVLGILDDPRALFLPVLTLALITFASFSRFVRSSMLDALNEDYIRTAVAAGGGRSHVLYRHALRNALMPIATLIGLTLPWLVSGSFITESVFNYPGMGRLGVNAIINDDLPTLIGTVVVFTIVTVIGSLLADILYAVLDPRVRYS